MGKNPAPGVHLWQQQMCGENAGCVSRLARLKGVRWMQSQIKRISDRCGMFLMSNRTHDLWIHRLPSERGRPSASSDMHGGRATANVQRG